MTGSTHIDPIPQNPTSPERRFKMSHRLIAGLAGGALAITGIAVAVDRALNAQGNPNGLPPAGSTPTPGEGGETPTPTPTETDPSNGEEEYVPFPPELQALADMQDLAEFAAQDKDLLRQYAAFIANNPMDTNLGRTLDEYEAEYAKESKNPLDVLPTASKTNTAQEILTITAAHTRYAFGLSGLDRQKYIIALAHDGIESPLYDTLSAAFDKEPENAAAWVFASKNELPVSTAVDSTGVQESDGSAGIVADRITYVSAEDGKTYETVFYFDEVTLPDGTDYATWWR